MLGCVPKPPPPTPCSIQHMLAIVSPPRETIVKVSQSMARCSKEKSGPPETGDGGWRVRGERAKEQEWLMLTKWLVKPLFSSMSAMLAEMATSSGSCSKSLEEARGEGGGPVTTFACSGQSWWSPAPLILHPVHARHLTDAGNPEMSGQALSMRGTSWSGVSPAGSSSNQPRAASLPTGSLHPSVQACARLCITDDECAGKPARVCMSVPHS